MVGSNIANAVTSGTNSQTDEDKSAGGPAGGRRSADGIARPGSRGLCGPSFIGWPLKRKLVFLYDNGSRKSNLDPSFSRLAPKRLLPQSFLQSSCGRGRRA